MSEIFKPTAAQSWDKAMNTQPLSNLDRQAGLNFHIFPQKTKPIAEIGGPALNGRVVRVARENALLRPIINTPVIDTEVSFNRL